jgi:hypothetical protein
MYMHCFAFFILSIAQLLFVYPACYLSLWRDPGPFFYIYITIYFLQALFTFLQTNIYYHMICLILCLQQTSEIDNLTASWCKVLWLCCVHVPRCCWRRSYAPNRHHKQILWSRRQSQLASTFRSGFFQNEFLKIPYEHSLVHYFHRKGF